MQKEEEEKEEEKEEKKEEKEKNMTIFTKMTWGITNNYDQWTLFIIRLRLLFYFVFRTRSICFRNIYRLQMALGVWGFLNFSYFNVLYRSYRVNNKVIDLLYILM